MSLSPGQGMIIQQINTTNNNGNVTYKSYDLASLPADAELRSLKISPQQFKEWFPNLGEMNFAHSMSTIQTLCAMELKASGKMREKKPLSTSLYDQLRENVREVTADKVWGPELDNRCNLLHSLTFARMPIISSEKLFQMAAERYTPGDIPPISAYDLTGLGLSDVVITAKGKI